LNQFCSDPDILWSVAANIEVAMCLAAHPEHDWQIVKI
jgi:hypothetical protein